MGIQPIHEEVNRKANLAEVVETVLAAARRSRPISPGILHDISEISEDSRLLDSRTQAFSDLRLAFALHYDRERSGFKEESMTLKIQRSADGEFVVFTLSGRIKAEHVAELQ